MPAHRTQNTRRLHVEAAPMGAPPINIISPTPQTFIFPDSISADTNGNAESASFSFTFQTNHSLPNLFAFHTSSNSGPYSSFFAGDQSPTGSQTSVFSGYTDSPTSVSGSSFASPANSLYESSFPSSPPDTSGTPSLSPSPPPSNSSADGDHHLITSSPIPYPHPLPPHSNGQVRTQPPRPPNPWICFRNVRTAQYKSTGEFPKLSGESRTRSAPGSPAPGAVGLDGEARRPRQADLSKHISMEWKALSDEERAPYVRMSEEAKIVHARIYPGYKYQPRRKLDGATRAEGAKKSAKTKKSVKKSSKGSKVPKKRDGQLEEPHGGDQFEGQVDVEAEPSTSSISLPGLDVDVKVHDQEVVRGAGDPSKDWTWLPEQTLLPIDWELEPDQKDTMSDGVMHPLDANVGEQDENGENVFGKPFFLSFPPLSSSPEGSSSSLSPLFPFPHDSESQASLFANYNFQASALGLQDVHTDNDAGNSQSSSQVIEDIGHILDFGLAEHSLYAAPEAYEPYHAPFSAEMVDEFGATETQDQTLHSPSVPQAPVQGLPPNSSADSSVNRSWLPLNHSTRGLGSHQPTRRGSLPTHLHTTSPDGHLCPPQIPHSRAQTRPRRKSVFATTASSSDMRTDVRSIPTGNYNASSGIMTSILIPKAAPRYESDLERDLEEYKRAMGTLLPEPVAAKASSSSTTPTPAGKAAENETGAASPGETQNIEDGDLDLNLEFDFEAEFGDIVDIHGSRDRSASS